MKQALRYSLKVWITTVVLAPIGVLILLGLLSDSTILGIVFWYPMIVLGSLMSSFLSASLLLLGVFYVSRLNITEKYKKVCLSILSVGSTLLSFYLISGSSLSTEVGYKIIAYALVFIACVWFYKLIVTSDLPNELINNE